MAVEIIDTDLNLGARERGQTHNPRDARCMLHLRRICGTCTHYQGPLRPARLGHDPKSIDTAPCAHFGGRTHRLRRAHDCPRWQRKTREPQQ